MVFKVAPGVAQMVVTPDVSSLSCVTARSWLSLKTIFIVLGDTIIPEPAVFILILPSITLTVCGGNWTEVVINRCCYIFLALTLLFLDTLFFLTTTIYNAYALQIFVSSLQHFLLDYYPPVRPTLHTTIPSLIALGSRL